MLEDLSLEQLQTKLHDTVNALQVVYDERKAILQLIDKRKAAAAAKAKLGAMSDTEREALRAMLAGAVQR